MNPFVEFLLLEEKKPESKLVAPAMSWPWKPRSTKRLTKKERQEIRGLLRHVKRGNMEIADICSAFDVSLQTVKRINKRPQRNSKKG